MTTKHAAMNRIRNLSVSAGLLACCLFLALPAQAKQVGEVKYARGAITIQKEDGSGARLIGKGEALNQGEVIKTGPKSFAIIKLADDTRMTIRPETAFAVEQMDTGDSLKKRASALFNLFRGGLRAITGYISKKNPGGVRIRTSVATIGIRGTEFDARLCSDDCQQENTRLEKKQKRKQTLAIGRVAFKRGELEATDFADNTRTLQSRSNLYEGDTLFTGDDAYAVITFRDKSRISLQANSEFRIDEMRYREKQKAGTSALFSLLRGGLRAVTGLIGKIAPENYSMRTRVTTIGIRGTGYDLLCTGPCANGALSRSDLPRGDGLYANVWEGSIVLGDQPLETGQSAFVKNAATPPVVLPTVPNFFKTNPVPRPDKVDVGKDEQAGPGESEVPPGLYVSVKDGEVTIKPDKTDQLVQVSKGQAAFADTSGQLVQQLPTIPLFQQLDSYPTPDNTSPKTLDIGNTIVGEDGEGMVCEIQ